jgi:hypothetical protein
LFLILGTLFGIGMAATILVAQSVRLDAAAGAAFALLPRQEGRSCGVHCLCPGCEGVCSRQRLAIRKAIGMAALSSRDPGHTVPGPPAFERSAMRDQCAQSRHSASHPMHEPASREGRRGLRWHSMRSL